MERTFEEWDRKATEAIDGAEAQIKNLWGRAQASAKGEPPPDPSETVTLEARPEAVKVLYARVLAAQCLVDGRQILDLHPASHRVLDKGRRR